MQIKEAALPRHFAKTQKNSTEEGIQQADEKELKIKLGHFPWKGCLITYAINYMP